MIRAQVQHKFSEFFHSWVAQVEEYAEHLLKASRDQQLNEAELQTLVSKLISHFKQYYTVKWAHAHQDVLAFFSPAWQSPMEKAHTWVTGWKPSMAFRLVANAVAMSEEQVKKMEALRVRIKLEEEKVEREMQRQQVAMADRWMKVERRWRDGEVVVGRQLEVAVRILVVGLEKT